MLSCINNINAWLNFTFNYQTRKAQGLVLKDGMIISTNILHHKYLHTHAHSPLHTKMQKNVNSLAEPGCLCTKQVL